MKFSDLFKKQSQQVDLTDDRWSKMLYSFLASGTNIRTDYSAGEYVSKGYGDNTSVYSIVNKIATMFSLIPLVPVKMKPDGTFEKVNKQSSSLKWLFDKPNFYQNLVEFMRQWESFLLVTGNSIVYKPTLQNGNDAGKVIETYGIRLLPTQNIEIESGGWRESIKYYKCDLSGSIEKIECYDIWHTRFVSLCFEDGNNFIGQSPLKVAAELIEGTNAAQTIIRNTLKAGMPKGILTKVEDGYTEDRGKELKENLEKKWREKYGKGENVSPIIGFGDLRWIPMGFSTLRDLMIVELNEDGIRQLCSIYGVPSILFNDTKGSTYNNVNEAGKQIYTNRIIPDMRMFIDGFNAWSFEAYGEGIMADYSQVPELQDDKGKQAEWTSRLVALGTMTGNEQRKILGQEESKDPAMNRHLIPMQNQPLEPIDEEEAEEELKNRGINDYK